VKRGRQTSTWGGDKMPVSEIWMKKPKPRKKEKRTLLAKNPNVYSVGGWRQPSKLSLVPSEWVKLLAERPCTKRMGKSRSERAANSSRTLVCGSMKSMTAKFHTRQKRPLREYRQDSYPGDGLGVCNSLTLCWPTGVTIELGDKRFAHNRTISKLYDCGRQSASRGCHFRGLQKGNRKNERTPTGSKCPTSARCWYRELPGGETARDAFTRAGSTVCIVQVSCYHGSTPYCW